MRNPFRRQIETVAPTLHERADALRASLSHREAIPSERADLYDRLLTLYAEDRQARPISGREDGTVAKRAAELVMNRTWTLAREIIAMPPPKTMEGLRLTALASAILCEADHSADDPTSVAATGLTRAVLAFTGTPLPSGFVGFGDEDDHNERDDALFAAVGSVPAWAVAEVEGKKVGQPAPATRALDPQPASEESPVAKDVPADLPAAILNAWAAWRATELSDGQEETPENLAAWEQASAEMNRLCDLAADLPAASENITAKALAAAWNGWVFSERPKQQRDDYCTDERCLFDMNAAIVARGTKGATELPLSSLVPTINFTGASMKELRSIREAADLVSGVAGAATWQGCNRLSDHPSGGARHNQAGELMRWISDALCHVVTAAEKEARRRTPDNSDDREMRLAMLAASTIDNGDLAETAAFARDFLSLMDR